MSDDLQEVLRQAVGKKIPTARLHTIKWPTQIKSSLDGDCCKIHLLAKSVTANMQGDAAAFEGWVLVIKAWLADVGIRRVEMSWEHPVESNGHYQRFLYRVIRFSRLFSWFLVSSESKSELMRSDLLEVDGAIIDKPFCLNTEGKRDSIIDKQAYTSEVRIIEFSEMSEHETEMLFMANSSPLLRCVFAEDGQELRRQLPVGVFDGVPKKEASVFTHGKSAVDLWAVNSEKVVLFELKKPTGNKRVGAISELFFYMNVISDLRDGAIQLPDDRKHDLFRDKKVEGYLLLGEVHPLLSEDVFTELNAGLAQMQSHMGLVSYGACDKQGLWCKKVYQ